MVAGEKVPRKTEQAEWLSRLYSERTRWPEVEKIFWAFFRDTADHFHDDVDHFGLVRNDLSIKPAFSAYRGVRENGILNQTKQRAAIKRY